VIQGKDEPFIVGDLGDVVAKYRTWVRALPRIKPFYGNTALQSSSLFSWYYFFILTYCELLEKIPSYIFSKIVCAENQFIFIYLY